jgi:hypothetical protein
MSRSLLFVAALTAATALPAQAPLPTTPPLDSVFAPVKWRSIGPFRGGRSNASTGVVGDPKTYYMGTTGGGVWKTDNMGISWRNCPSKAVRRTLTQNRSMGRTCVNVNSRTWGAITNVEKSRHSPTRSMNIPKY